MFSIQTR